MCGCQTVETQSKTKLNEYDLCRKINQQKFADTVVKTLISFKFNVDVKQFVTWSRGMCSDILLWLEGKCSIIQNTYSKDISVYFYF